MTRTDVDAISNAGTGKAQLAKMQPLRFLTRAAMAGVFIFVGALISVLSAAWFYSESAGVSKLLGASTFSIALILIVLLGGELFTGSNLVMGVALYEGRVKIADVLRVWVLCYIGNFVGVLVLSLLFAGSGASRDVVSAYLAIIVPGKLTAPWYILLLKGVLCNFLVCLGVFGGFKLKSELGKAMVIICVITTFVLSGLEHSIANMAYFSLYTLMVDTAHIPAMGWNMLWATLGNILGGAVLLGLPLWYSAENVKAD